MKCLREFPGGPEVRNLTLYCWVLGLIPNWGIRIPQATWHDQKKKTKKNKKKQEVPKVKSQSLRKSEFESRYQVQCRGPLLLPI